MNLLHHSNSHLLTLFHLPTLSSSTSAGSLPTIFQQSSDTFDIGTISENATHAIQIIRFEPKEDYVIENLDFPHLIGAQHIQTHFLLKWNVLALKHAEVPSHGAILHTQMYQRNRVTLSKPTRQFFALGSNLGIVRFLDFRGRVVFEEMWAEAPVLNMKVTSTHLIILYAKRMILVNRERLLEALCGGNFEGGPMGEDIYEQIEVNGQARILDAWVLSEGEDDSERRSLDSLDMLQMMQQYELEQEQPGTHFNSLLCVGEKPSIAMYLLDQRWNNLSSGSSSMFSATKLASKYATKLGSSLVSAMSFWSSKETHTKDDRTDSKQHKHRNHHNIEPAFYFDDAPREVYHIQVEERTNAYAACVDFLGRVILFEPHSLQLIHLFKGYREAHAQFFTLQEEQYLLLYAPLRGLVEIWTLPALQRIEAFQVERKSLFVDVIVAQDDDTNEETEGQHALVHFLSPTANALYSVMWKCHMQIPDQDHHE